MCSVPSTPADALPSAVAATPDQASLFQLVWTRTERGNIALTIYASPDATFAMLDAIAEGAPVLLQQAEPPPYDNASRDALRLVVDEASKFVKAIADLPPGVNEYRCSHGALISEPCLECENELPF